MNESNQWHLPSSWEYTDQDVEPPIPPNLQEEYDSLLKDLLTGVPVVTPMGNRVRDEQRKLKAQKRQAAKDC